MKINYFISKWKKNLPEDFPRDGHIEMLAVPRKKDNVYFKGYEFKVTGEATWMVEPGGKVHIPRIYLT